MPSWTLFPGIRQSKTMPVRSFIVVALCSVHQHCASALFTGTLTNHLISSETLTSSRTQLLQPQDTSQLNAGSTSSDNLIWLLGIPISLLGSTLTVLGLLLQKKSHEPEHIDSDSSGEVAPPTLYCLNLKWVSGLLLFAVGNLVTWISLGMAPNAVLSCFNSWSIICTLVLAPRWFQHEVISSRTWLCAAVLVAGCTWVAIAGPRSYRSDTITDINKGFKQPAFLWCTACIGCFFALALFKYYREWQQKSWQLLTVAQITAASAICASYAMLLSKCSSVLMQSSLQTSHNEMHDEFFAYLTGTIVCGALQIHFLNEGVKRGAASFIMPFYQSLAIAIQIVAGGMLFQEYAGFTWQQHLYFWPGVAVVLVGVVALTKFAAEDQTEQGTPGAAGAKGPG
eukprot:TRINITY_DN89377_c0_g1_i1.p1 TRINITY_DN89377_c0_g1~~TRINITY_DN89377_c0_g1_i1.p1  ORF type:complete len:397 (-),score=25.37 TRINITY_DN89377_c0_g1_i1:304-1494(-)